MAPRKQKLAEAPAALPEDETPFTPPPAANLRAEVTTEWAGEERTFRLTVQQILELEQRCSAPVALVYNRVQRGEYSIEDVRQTVRLGLIGGGASPADAARLMSGYGYPARPLAELWALARVVLHAAMFRFEAAPLGNREAAAPSP